MGKKIALRDELAQRDPRELKRIQQLGQEALKDTKLIDDAVELLDSEDKNMRIGSIGVLREVAAEKPHLVVKHLDRVIESLNRKEKPTRWIATDICRYCARLEPEKVEQVVPKIAGQMTPKEGTVLMVQSARFMGAFGSLDETRARKVFPYLEQALKTYPENTIGLVVESIAEIVPLLKAPLVDKVSATAQKFLNHKSAATRKKTKQLLAQIEKLAEQ